MPAKSTVFVCGYHGFPPARERRRRSPSLAEGFCRANGLDFIFGVAPSATLRRHVETLEASTKARFEAGAQTAKVRCFKEFYDGAASWRTSGMLFPQKGVYRRVTRKRLLFFCD